MGLIAHPKETKAPTISVVSHNPEQNSQEIPPSEKLSYYVSQCIRFFCYKDYAIVIHFIRSGLLFIMYHIAICMRYSVHPRGLNQGQQD